MHLALPGGIGHFCTMQVALTCSQAAKNARQVVPIEEHIHIRFACEATARIQAWAHPDPKCGVIWDAVITHGPQGTG